MKQSFVEESSMYHKKSNQNIQKSDADNGDIYSSYYNSEYIEMKNQPLDPRYKSKNNDSK